MTAEHDTTSGWWSGRTLRTLGGEVAALARMAWALPLGGFVAGEHPGEDGVHRTPVVMVHGLFGHPTNFGALRAFLAARGIRRFASFAYAPRIDYQRLAAGLAERIDAVRRETGAYQVDVVAHSLGGLTARYLIQAAGSTAIRRLVTLGSPYWTTANPPQELAIFGSGDAIVPPPAVRPPHTIVVRDCGHLGLLHDRRVLRATARFLTTRALVPVVRTRAAA
jgi:pimeloyl-ACP methyl ester carboxylesterase